MSDKPEDPRIQEILNKAEENDWAAPGGIYWDKMWKMLPEIDGKRAPYPLVLSGFHFSDDNMLHDRFYEHLVWAQETGVLDKVIAYLDRLPAKKWYPKRPGHEEYLKKMIEKDSNTLDDWDEE